MDSKAWYASKTMWTGLLILAAGIANLFGVVITPEEQAGLVELINTMILTFGGLATLVFRKKAEKKIQ